MRSSHIFRQVLGISIYSGDGERIEKLLSEADQHLYAEKAKRAKKHPPHPSEATVP